VPVIAGTFDIGRDDALEEPGHEFLLVLHRSARGRRGSEYGGHLPDGPAVQPMMFDQ
jgi:hypothetical protein